jgi:Tfp pilus assembly protein PilO
MKKMKRPQINIQTDRSTTMMVFAGVAAVILAISIVGTKIVFQDAMFERKVLVRKKAASEQLVKNIKSVDGLRDNLKDLNKTPETSNKQILNVLPSTFDFPQTSATIEGLANKNGIEVESISMVGDEDTVVSSGVMTSDSNEVQSMVIGISAKGSYPNIRQFLTDLTNSRRAFGIEVADISGRGAQLSTTINVRAYYKPIVSTDIKKEVIKE